MNELLAMLARDVQFPMLGVVIGKDKTKPTCKVKFADGTDLESAAQFVISVFTQWAKRTPEQCQIHKDAANLTVEVFG